MLPATEERWRLGEIAPRRAERAGADTGKRYEYQSQQTALAALTLLDDGRKHVCAYCDWHDDYVIEVGDPPTRYVSTRSRVVTPRKALGRSRTFSA